MSFTNLKKTDVVFDLWRTFRAKVHVIPQGSKISLSNVRILDETENY
jgi:hypothetical protein